jgi:hypothetical protein
MLHKRRGVFTFLSEFDSFNLAFADAISAGQSTIAYENLPARSYFKNHGIEIIGAAIPVGTKFVGEARHNELLEDTMNKEPLFMEKMRREVQELLIENSKTENYMEEIYG